jgi:hypothetical protein
MVRNATFEPMAVGVGADGDAHRIVGGDNEQRGAVGPARG